MVKWHQANKAQVVQHMHYSRRQWEGKEKWGKEKEKQEENELPVVIWSFPSAAQNTGHTHRHIKQKQEEGGGKKKWETRAPQELEQSTRNCVQSQAVN